MHDKFTAPLFLGADGGQTRSIAVLADSKGQMLGVGHGGPCNHFDEPGGDERFRSAIKEIVTGAFADAERSMTEGLAAACFGLTGAWDHALTIVRALLPVERLIAVEDTVSSQAGAFAGGAGIVVIGGTGSVAYGRDEDRNTARVGGWGHLMGDEGSAYDIGRQALRATAKAYDGRGPATLLLDRIPKYFGLVDLEAVQEALYAGRLSRVDIASLAKVTAGAASEQDTVAYALFDAAAAALAGMAIAVARRLSWSAPMVSPVGGVFKAGAIILEPFTRYLREDLPEATVRPPRYPPVLGSVLLAMQDGGYCLDQTTLGYLDQAAAQLELGE